MADTVVEAGANHAPEIARKEGENAGIADFMGLLQKLIPPGTNRENIRDMRARLLEMETMGEKLPSAGEKWGRLMSTLEFARFVSDLSLHVMEGNSIDELQRALADAPESVEKMRS
jgi:hypothetical protein